jgi:hypothetical protein
VTEKGMKSTSRLLVQRARGADAGVYTCGPNNAPSASTRVHVLSGKILIEVHRNAGQIFPLLPNTPVFD